MRKQLWIWIGLLVILVLSGLFLWHTFYVCDGNLIGTSYGFYDGCYNGSCTCGLTGKRTCMMTRMYCPEYIACSSKDAMCVSNNDARIQRGKSIIFGVTINNYLSQETEFSIKIEKTNSDTTNPFPAVNDVVIDAKSSKTTAFGINVPKETAPGQYSYVVRVTSSNNEFAPISKRYNFRVVEYDIILELLDTT
jgi:hypothetical protein